MQGEIAFYTRIKSNIGQVYKNTAIGDKAHCDVRSINCEWDPRGICNGLMNGSRYNSCWVLSWVFSSHLGRVSRSSLDLRACANICLATFRSLQGSWKGLSRPFFFRLARFQTCLLVSLLEIERWIWMLPLKEAFVSHSWSEACMDGRGRSLVGVR